MLVGAKRSAWTDSTPGVHMHIASSAESGARITSTSIALQLHAQFSLADRLDSFHALMLRTIQHDSDRCNLSNA